MDRKFVRDEADRAARATALDLAVKLAIANKDAAEQAVADAIRFDSFIRTAQ